MKLRTISENVQNIWPVLKKYGLEPSSIVKFTKGPIGSIPGYCIELGSYFSHYSAPRLLRDGSVDIGYCGRNDESILNRIDGLSLQDLVPVHSITGCRGAPPIKYNSNFAKKVLATFLDSIENPNFDILIDAYVNFTGDLVKPDHRKEWKEENASTHLGPIANIYCDIIRSVEPGVVQNGEYWERAEYCDGMLGECIINIECKSTVVIDFHADFRHRQDSSAIAPDDHFDDFEDEYGEEKLPNAVFPAL